MPASHAPATRAPRPPDPPLSPTCAYYHPGKTTLLRHLLEKSGLRIGCVVNDVASVNIDAKLVRNDRARDKKDGGKEGGGDGAPTTTTADLADTVELANGCACAFFWTEERGEVLLLQAPAARARVPLGVGRESSLSPTTSFPSPLLSSSPSRLLHPGRAVRLL